MARKSKTDVDALLDSGSLFSLFMEHMPAAAFLKDLKGRYVYVNPSFVKIAGRAPELSVGAAAEDYWPESAGRLREEDDFVVRTGEAMTSEDSCENGSETRYYQTVKFPIPNRNGDTALVAGVSVDITARKVEQLEHRALLAKAAIAHEEERWRISRELHDDLTQRLASLAMEVGRIAAEPADSGAEQVERLRSLQRGLVQAAEVARHTAHELHPLELDDLGLVAVLRSYCEDFATREGIAVELESRIPGKLRREVGSCVYKVAQESLNNVAKHSAADRVSVILDGTEESIRLRVKDSGIGFSVARSGARIGLGLLSMEERVGLLRGSFRIRSQPGQGTEVIAHVPLEAQ